jgi:hypothetical protein
MLSWAILAGASLMYMGSFALHPDNQDKFLTKPLQSNQESNRAELDRAQLTAQVRSLHETVASLQSDLERFRDAQRDADTASPATTSATQPTEQPTDSFFNQTTPMSTASLPRATPPLLPSMADPRQSSDKATTQETAASNLPQVIAPPARDAVSTSSPTPDAGAQPARKGNYATRPLRSGKLPPLPQLRQQQSSYLAPAQSTDPSQPLLLNSTTGQASTQSSTIQTGSITASQQTTLAPAQPKSSQFPSTSTQPSARTTTAPAFGTPVVKPRQVASASAAIALSTASSITGLRASWLLLTTRHGDSFKGYEPRYIANQATGTYRLIAGPIANHAEADRVCTELRAQDVNCGVTTFAGAPLQ